MAYSDTIAFPTPSNDTGSLVEQLAPDICRMLAGPRDDGAVAGLRALLGRVAQAFGADDAYVHCQLTDVSAPTRLTTSERAGRLATALFEGQWFSRELAEATRVFLPRGPLDMPPDADHERHCLRAAGVQAVVACAIPADDLVPAAFLVVFAKRPFSRWVAPALDQLQNVGALFARAITWAYADSVTAIESVKAPRTLPTQRLDSDSTIVGASDALRFVLFRVDQVSPTNASVLLLGETGTGKELIARAIHNRSHRRNHSFVVVNCGALPATLIESELFGRERGAFTGAHTAQAGRFELANGGTLFLDEIGELPLELQPNLLRVLQEGQLQRLGSTRTTTVDVRVIAATNRNLSEEVHRGRFRRDLFYRLNVFPITLPALRERREDLALLVPHLVRRLGRQLGKTVDHIRPDVLHMLEQHDWPGNIRELENVLQQAIILSRDGELELPGLPPLADPGGDPPPVREQSRMLVDIERDHIKRVLGSTSGRIEGSAGAARVLGLRPSTLRSLMRRLGVTRSQAAPIRYDD
jgi:transcriptional regulator with GAF, ATPase, and Fis domain